jgi:hypothetical protein
LKAGKTSLRGIGNKGNIQKKIIRVKKIDPEAGEAGMAGKKIKMVWELKLNKYTGVQKKST